MQYTPTLHGFACVHLNVLLNIFLGKLNVHSDCVDVFVLMSVIMLCFALFSARLHIRSMTSVASGDSRRRRRYSFLHRTLLYKKTFLCILLNRFLVF